MVPRPVCTLSGNDESSMNFLGELPRTPCWRSSRTSVDELFSAVLGGQRAGTPKEPGASCRRPRSEEGVPSVCGGGAYCEALRPRTTLSAAKPEAISPAAAAPAIGPTGGPPVEASALAVALADALAEADALAVEAK